MPTAGNRVVIVGAGAAGVFAAYRLREMYGDRYDIKLFESSDRVGGNAFSTKVKYGQREYNIDCGAQFFYKTPQPSYTALLEHLGLMDDRREVISAPAGFTIWDKKKNARRMWVPSRIGDFLKYSFDDWDRMLQFGIFLSYAYFLDREDPSNWKLSLDDWFSTLHLLDSDFKQKILKPFMYQFTSLPLSRMGEASALYSITYFVRNVFGEPTPHDIDVDPPSIGSMPTFTTYQSMIGLDTVMKKALEHVKVTPMLKTAVKSIGVEGGVTKVRTADGGVHPTDHVILACDPQASATILQAGGTSDPTLVDTLKSLEYVGLPISMQKGGNCWMPSDKNFWEPVNTVVDGNSVTFNAWFGKLRPTYLEGRRIPVFKTWGHPDVKGAQCQHQFLGHRHFVLLPTTKFCTQREALRKFQGKFGIWFAGGWSKWFDSQEAALDSSTAIAILLPGIPQPFTGPATMVSVDHDRVERNLRTWLERIARSAPPERRQALRRAFDEVASQG